MEYLYKCRVFFVICILFLIGCQATNQEKEEIVQNESEKNINDVGSRAVMEEEQDYEVESLVPETASDNMFHWVILQNGRFIVNEDGVQKINDRLYDLNLDANLSFHIVKMEESVTPQILEKVYDQLEGKMDFVSIGPALCGFSMNDWNECFVELTDKLHEGKLKEFYETVPAKVWESNQMADGIYSFSNSSRVMVFGYLFDEEVWKEWGKENLLKLTEAKGIENEEVWEDLHQLTEAPVIEWSGLYVGHPVGTYENMDQRVTLSQITNMWEKPYYVNLTDDIRYSIEEEKFVWLPESEKYLQLKDKTEEFYHKGYLGEVDAVNYEVETMGNVKAGNTDEIRSMVYSSGIERELFWVPPGTGARISTEERSDYYMYSFVYHKANAGWEEVLNGVGTDEQISDIINKSDIMTISDVIYGEVDNFVVTEYENQYELIEETYANAEMDPIEGFIFNPVPIQEIWKQYNQRAAAAIYAAEYGKLYVSDKESGMFKVSFEAIDKVWDEYLKLKEEGLIDIVLDEVNRQYQEWLSEREIS